MFERSEFETFFDRFLQIFKRYVVLAEGTSDRKGYNSADIRFLTYEKTTMA